jgi:hypothetical protein
MRGFTLIMIFDPLPKIFREPDISSFGIGRASKQIDVKHHVTKNKLSTGRAIRSWAVKGKSPSFALRASEGILRFLTSAKNGGEGGIRTHGGLSTTSVFKTEAINHSTTSPDAWVDSFLIHSELARCQEEVFTSSRHAHLRVGIAFVLIDPLGAAFVFIDQFSVIHTHEMQDRGV